MTARFAALLKYVPMLFVLIAVWPITAHANELKDVRVIASIFPPYSYSENRHAKGVAVEIVQELFAELNLKPKIELYPWARALKTAQNTPNALLFSVARTPQREDMFTWIGPIVDFDVYVYRKADRNDIVINDTEDLTPYSFAGLLKDVKTGFLTDLGVYLHKVSNEETAFKMLSLGRVDLVASDMAAANRRFEILGYDRADFVPAYKLSALSKPLYLVANKDTDPAVIAQLRKAMAALMQRRQK